MGEDGESRISIESNPNRDVDAAANDIRDRVSGLLDNLPDEDVIMGLNLSSDRFTVPEPTGYAERSQVAVFVPIAFLEEDIGRLSAEFALTMAPAVCFSSLIALTLLPTSLENICVRSERSGELIPWSNVVSVREFADSTSLNRYNRVLENLPETAMVDYKGQSQEPGEAANYVRSIIPEPIRQRSEPALQPPGWVGGAGRAGDRQTDCQRRRLWR